MEVDLTADQQELRAAAGDVLTGLCPPTRVRSARYEGPGWDEALWTEFSDLDFMGLLVPEEFGGVGAGIVEAAVLLEEAGRVAFPGPIVETFLAASVLAKRPDQHAGVLGEIAKGTTRVTVRIDEGLVPYVGCSDYIVLLTSDHVGLAPISATTAEEQRSVERTRPLARVRPATWESIAEDRRVVADVAAHLAVLLSAYSVGVGAQMLDMTVRYVLERHQFGRPIGSFQAVKHKLADAHVAVETARTAVWAAAQLVDDQAQGSATAAAVARLAAIDALTVVNQHALQFHGGIGFAVEHDLHLWLTLGKALERSYGSARRQRALIADTLLGPVAAS